VSLKYRLADEGRGPFSEITSTRTRTLPGANSTFGLDASLVAWLTVTLLWICAAYFLATMGRQAETSRTIV